ncbi:MAG: hypothetical protein WD030_06285 [Pirellulales bacterium]
MPRFTFAAAIFTLLVVPAVRAEDPPAKALPPAAEKPALNEHEQAFKQMLDGATLIGHFTVDGKENGELSEERYAIKSVDKINDDTWRFNVRIQYKTHDLTLPLPLKVLWAGDTAVVTLDKVAIPPLGTFNSRVLFHDDRYAGTWEHVGAAGGNLFGKIVREGDK